MSSIGLIRDLSELFLWVGIAGAGIALICAIVALIALAMGAAGVAGGASAAWIGGALLSLASGFSGQWVPAIVAAGGLVVALVLGAVARSIVQAFERRPKPEPMASSAAAAPSSAPAPVLATPRIVGVDSDL